MRSDVVFGVAEGRVPHRPNGAVVVPEPDAYSVRTLFFAAPSLGIAGHASKLLGRVKYRSSALAVPFCARILCGYDCQFLLRIWAVWWLGRSSDAATLDRPLCTSH